MESMTLRPQVNETPDLSEPTSYDFINFAYKRRSASNSESQELAAFRF